MYVGERGEWLVPARMACATVSGKRRMGRRDYGQRDSCNGRDTESVVLKAKDATDKTKWRRDNSNPKLFRRPKMMRISREEEQVDYMHLRMIL